MPKAGKFLQQQRGLGRANAGQAAQILLRGRAHGFHTAEAIPQKARRGWPYAGQAHEFARKGRTALGLAVTSNGKAVGAVAHILQKKQLRPAFPQGQGIDPVRHKNTVCHIAGASVCVALLVPGLGNGSQGEKIRLPRLLQCALYGAQLAAPAVNEQQVGPGGAAFKPARHPGVQCGLVVAAVGHGIGAVL